ncbi:MAG: type VI secretion protein IcmF/TssM N-terminal domain-containing protein [Planctomycetota bacterium]|nr:type VI secretion protein IcmF/TssM N-terminal domain-containing protein [Planctomycetota bacterium]
MSTAEPEPKPRGKISRFFGAIFGFPRKLLSLSLPTKAALVVLFVLLTVVIVAWIVFLVDPESVPWRHSMGFGRIVAVLCLLTLIPIVLHRGLKLWLEGESSQFPDIDFAWRAGVDALKRNGIDLGATPLFLVLGSSDDQQEQAVMTASGLSLRVRDVPEGPSPLHWYANPDGVFLFCSGASWLSALSELNEKRKTDDVARALPDLEGPTEMRMAAGEMQAPTALSPVGFSSGAAPVPASGSGSYGASSGAPVAAAPVSQVNQGDARGTIMLDSYTASALAASMNPPAAGAAGGGAVYSGSAANLEAMAMQEAAGRHGTIMLQAPLGDPSKAGTFAAPQTMQTPAPSMATPAYSGGSPQRSAALLPPQESAEQLRRLGYVGQLLRRARQPLCGANGILTLLPFEMVAGGTREAEELQRATKSDLRTLQRTLELQCPITALVVGLEKEAGFRELVRRVGRDRTSVQRFGQRYDVRSIATTEELASLCAHVCGTFEDWVYTLFREQGALSRPGNTRLYGLLCKVRTQLKNRLSSVLANGYGHETAGSGQDALFFSGCYFAATGDSNDRQAFVAGVMQKLTEEQEEVEWTQRALRTNRRWRRVAVAGLIANAALLATLGGMIVYKLFW